MPCSVRPLLSAALALLTISAQAADLPAGVLGLVALPEVFSSPSCEPHAPQDVPLYAAAEDRAAGRAPAGVITVVQPMGLIAPGTCNSSVAQLRWSDGKTSEEWPIQESGYEERAAVVVGRRGDMLQITTDRAPAWIHRPGLAGYMPAGMLLKDKLLELPRDLRPLARTAAAGTRQAHLAWEPKSASVRQAREIRGETWLQLEVRAAENCTDTTVGPRATVWVPFHDAQRQPTLWFYSRGC
ncbi:hypothetical protein [Pelomonas cellulosilytica]|uniref:SH3 domain-containing protein n=1 Tax=Pelomonas cellulosilytica TaxID=2906762 RepID=A0ABS8XQK5_9BURK|nr:hypothetical protein [Pelomonas sp. P8]MCE4553018.1 hypothetical protein [Pelomonas sp. P8]